ncbi:MAG: enoyl-CoA hydratase/isomerase family protein [Candidatus Sericytochromatia bacterium]|nr:enoyl-CoA hydratase/isomerase family protein [Candidatus Sericytochromatia bacterium]
MATRVSLARQGDVVFMLLDSPTGLNVLSTDTLRELRDHLATLADEPSLRGAVLVGSGHRAFSAGADLNEVATLTPDTANAFSALGQDVADAIATLRVPVIAALNGPAYGGGVELALACDVRVAAAHSHLQYQAARLGLLPGWGGTQRLPWLVGPARARRMMLEGERADAEKALAWGLVDDVAPGASLPAVLAERLARWRETDPGALAQTKRALNAAWRGDMASERAAFAACFESGTTQARIRAWLEAPRAAVPAAIPQPGSSHNEPRRTLGVAEGA